MLVDPYQSFGPLFLGQSKKEDCIEHLGDPTSIQIFQSGQEYYYDSFIVRFSKENYVVYECTILPPMTVIINELELTWDKKFLQKACSLDGKPLNIFGFVVFLNLGIAVTGIHDDDKSQLAVTVFCKGAFDDLLSEAVPFELDLQ